MRRWWPWRRRPSQETVVAQARLRAAIRDDRRVDAVEAAIYNTIAENHLAAAIRRVLEEK